MKKDYVGGSWEDIRSHVEDDIRIGAFEMAAATQEMQRIIYRCKTCKHTWAHDYQVEGKMLIRRWTPGPDDTNRNPFALAQNDKRCPNCQSMNVKVSEVVGTISSKPCDARCMEATSHVCNCSCAGANHGIAYL